MIGALEANGSIVAYNMGFEKGVIKALADFDTKTAKKLNALLDRFVDPLPVFRNHVYHPEFLGSFSIKAVGPALIGKKVNYENLDVGDGSEAQSVALGVMFGQMDEDAKKKAVAALFKYCEMDTMAMVELYKWLKENV